MIQFAVSKGCVRQLSPKKYLRAGRYSVALLALLLFATFAARLPSAIAHPGHAHNDERLEELPNEIASQGRLNDAAHKFSWYAYLVRTAGLFSVVGSLAAWKLRHSTRDHSPFGVHTPVLAQIVVTGFHLGSVVLGCSVVWVAWRGVQFAPNSPPADRIATVLATICGSWAVSGNVFLAIRRVLLASDRPPNAPTWVAKGLVALALAATCGIVDPWMVDREGRVASSCFLAIVALAACGAGIGTGLVHHSRGHAPYAALGWTLVAVAVASLGWSGIDNVSFVESEVVGGMMLASSLMVWRCLTLGVESTDSKPLPSPVPSEDQP